MSHHTLAGTSESEAVDPVFREGDQEATYVIVDLDGLEDQLFPAAGDQITLEGLDTDAPQLVLASGRRLKGHYEETVGSCVAFAEDLDPATRQFALQYMCHTHRKLKFTTELPATSAAT
ncbi:hypothetical protein WJX72_012153 [[Myrmecia] bisecta]|uniref:Transcription factor TFIIIC triple barrel domain-containing protein n=1 Tax=[Myrmecia] bisecta TaxID=41462 RepID=A0AAW1PK91_9CHLO